MGQLSWDEVRASGQALLADDDPDPQLLGAFAVAVRSLAPRLDAATLRALADLFAAVERHGRRQRDRVRQQLGQAGQGRRALKGYGHLRTFKRCQRASTRW